MAVYAQTRNFIFRVGGLNVTDHLTKLTLSRGHVDLSSPKTWSGSFELARIVGRDNNLLDDFAYPGIWRRGLQPVTLDIATNGATPSFYRVFTGKINVYRWNPNPLQQSGSGTLVDELGLQAITKRPSEIIKAGIEPLLISDLARDLLFKAATDADGNLTFGDIEVKPEDAVGEINATFTSSDPLRDAQEIFGVNQRWVYCNNVGAIKVKLFDWGVGSSFSLTLDETLSFDRDTTIQDYSAEKVIVSGTKQISKPVLPGVANEPDPPDNPDLDTEDRPLKIVTTETKTLGETTGNFNFSAIVNGGRETDFPITSTKTIEYTYSDEGDVIATTTTLEQPLGLVTGTFQLGSKNGTLEPFTFIVPEIIQETLSTRSETRLRGAITGSFNGNDTINGGLETITPITSTEIVTNFTEAELNAIKKIKKTDIPNLKFTNSDGQEQNLYEKEKLPKPENTIETLVFKGEANVPLGYTPYFNVIDERSFNYIENTDMAGSLATFIGKLEGARLKSYLIEIPLPTAYLSNPDPFLVCAIGGQSFMIDGEQIELQDGKMSLIFTGLPV